MLSTALAGSRKGGAGLALWSQNHDTATKVAAFPTNSNHDLFTTLQDLTTKNITIATRVPSVLANISEGVNLGSTGNEMQKAVELMQSRVTAKQQVLMQFYNKVLLPNWHDEKAVKGMKVEIVNFNPISVPVELDDKFWEVLTVPEKREFIRKNFPTVPIGEDTAQATAPIVDEEGNPVEQTVEATEKTTGNEALKNLNISDINKVQKIVARFNLSKVDPQNAKALTLDQAKQFLAGYGFTEEQINAWLVTEEELTDD